MYRLRYQEHRNQGEPMYELEQDETDPVANVHIQEFLKEYKALCARWDCYVAADGEDVEVVYDPEDAADDGPCARWGVEEKTAERRTSNA